MSDVQVVQVSQIASSRNQRNRTLTAVEDIPAGSLVNFVESGGLKVRLASADDQMKYAQGFAQSAISNGSSGMIHVGAGLLNLPDHGFSLTQRLYLGTDGEMVQFLESIEGAVQDVGFVLDDDNVWFDPEDTRRSAFSRILSVTRDIDMESESDTLVYAGPSDVCTVIERAVFRVQSAALSIATFPEISIGLADPFQDVIAPVVLDNLSAGDKVFMVQPSLSTSYRIVAAGNDLKLRVQSAASADLVASLDLMGYVLPCPT